MNCWDSLLYSSLKRILINVRIIQKEALTTCQLQLIRTFASAAVRAQVSARYLHFLSMKMESLSATKMYASPA